MIGSRYSSLLKAGTTACGALDKIEKIYMNLRRICLELPVVPHKAVAEVSKLETYRKGWLL